MLILFRIHEIRERLGLCTIKQVHWPSMRISCWQPVRSNGWLWATGPLLGSDGILSTVPADSIATRYSNCANDLPHQNNEEYSVPISLTANQETINQILGVAGVQVTIPQYQRPYSWANEQIDEFWADISDPEEDQHFMGPIVINTENPTSPEVIDGQQRLTTIVILQSLIRDRLVNLGGNWALPEAVLIDQAASGDQRFRLRSGQQNWVVLRDFILRNPSDSARRSVTSDVGSLSGDEKTWNRQLIRNVKRLAVYLDAYVAGLPDDRAVAKFQALSTFISMRLIFVSIKVSQLANAFLLFETLNDRGLQLSAADLLKSHLLHKVAQTSENVPDAAQRWDAMIDSLQGADPATFLRHYLLLEHEKVRKDQIYKRFKSTLETASAQDVLERLEDYADIYGVLMKPSIAPNESVRQVLQDIDGTSVKSTLIPLLAAGNALGSDHGMFVDFARVVESLAFRWTVCGLNAQKLETIFSAAGRLIEDSGPDGIPNASANLLSEIPEDESFQRRFADLRPTMKVARYVLRRYAGQQMPGGVVDIYGGTYVHVEHIMPKTSTPFWISRGGGPDEYKSTVALLGNLTLLSARLNTSISNADFATKKDAYMQGGNLPMTIEIAEKDDWTRSDIVHRQQDMTAVAPVIWPTSL